jgi:hypothetical protein
MISIKPKLASYIELCAWCNDDPNEEDCPYCEMYEEQEITDTPLSVQRRISHDLFRKIVSDNRQCFVTAENLACYGLSRKNGFNTGDPRRLIHRNGVETLALGHFALSHGTGGV